MCREYVLTRKCGCLRKDRLCDMGTSSCSVVQERIEILVNSFCEACIVNTSVYEDVKYQSPVDSQPRSFAIAEEIWAKHQTLHKTQEDGFFQYEGRITAADLAWLQEISVHLEISMRSMITVASRQDPLVPSMDVQKLLMRIQIQRVIERELISSREDASALLRRQECLDNGKSLLLRPITYDELKDDETDCVICRSTFKIYEPERPVKTPCGHLFGESCIGTWLQEARATCPTCRMEFSRGDFEFPIMGASEISPWWIRILRSSEHMPALAEKKPPNEAINYV